MHPVRAVTVLHQRDLVMARGEEEPLRGAIELIRTPGVVPVDVHAGLPGVDEQAQRATAARPVAEVIRGTTGPASVIERGVTVTRRERAVIGTVVGGETGLRRGAAVVWPRVPVQRIRRRSGI